MADGKRPHSPDHASNGLALVKKQKTNGDLAVGQKLSPEGLPRTSRLQAPTLLLTGHGGEVLTVKFSPDGETVASGSADKHIFLWRTFGDCDNYMMLKGHKNSILELHWTLSGDTIISASPDKTIRAWDVGTGEQIKKMAEHSSFVNSCCPLKRGPPLVVSGSDDGTAKLWDLRVKRSVNTFAEAYQIAAVAFSDAGDQIYTGGIENSVKVWDLRTEKISMELAGHNDTITGMRVSPDGAHLLTNAMDNTLKMWDMRPYAPANRCVKTFIGHQHNFEKNLLKCDWSPDGSKVTGGSADRMVYIWEVSSRRILYKLPGHSGGVNEVAFHPSEPVVLSASSDKQLYLGELA